MNDVYQAIYFMLVAVSLGVIVAWSSGDFDEY